MSKIEGPVFCKQEDVSEMIALVDSIMRKDAAGKSMLTDYPLVYQNNNLENVFIIKVDDQIVSVVPFIPHMAKINNCDFSVGIISPTATSPDHRRKGYALKCVKACVKKMADDCIDLSILWTQVPTFSFYEHAQYQGVMFQEWSFACLKEEAHNFKDHGQAVVKLENKYLGELQKMHDNEIYGIYRPFEKYKYLFNLPEIETLIALESGIPVAYLTVSNASNKPGIIEGGGDSGALETILHKVLTDMKQSRVDGFSYLTSTVLGDLLEKRLPVVTRKKPRQHMMVRMNNITGFLNKISKCLENKNGGIKREFSIKVTDTDETISFIFSENGLELGNTEIMPHFEFTRKELTSVVFGQHPERPVAVPDILSDIFPVYFPVWILDRS